MGASTKIFSQNSSKYKNALASLICFNLYADSKVLCCVVVKPF